MVKQGKAEKWAARSARLSAALRENLKRRKEQARERDIQRNLTRDSAHNHPAGGGSTPKSTESEVRVPDFRRNQGQD
jgi:hypothetical protein